MIVGEGERQRKPEGALSKPTSGLGRAKPASSREPTRGEGETREGSIREEVEVWRVEYCGIERIEDEGREATRKPRCGGGRPNM